MPAKVQESAISVDPLEKITKMMEMSSLAMEMSAEGLAKARETYDNLKTRMKTRSSGVDSTVVAEAQQNLMHYLQLRQVALQSHQMLKNSIETRISSSGINLELVKNLNRARTTPKSAKKPAELPMEVDEPIVDEIIVISSQTQQSPVHNKDPAGLDITPKLADEPMTAVDCEIAHLSDNEDTQHSSEELFNFKKSTNNRSIKPRKFVLESDPEDDDDAKSTAIVKQRKLKKDTDGIFEVSDESGCEDEPATAMIEDKVDFEFQVPPQPVPTTSVKLTKIEAEMARKYGQTLMKTTGIVRKSVPKASSSMAVNDEAENESADDEEEDEDDSDSHSSDMESDREESDDEMYDSPARYKKYPKKFIDKAVASPVPSTSSDYHNRTELASFNYRSVREFHNSLKDRPGEDVLDDQPDFLTVTLMRHQLHAIKFMRWRETQKMKGGMLADDMGLGKTLTTIALILKQLQVKRSQEFGEPPAPQPVWSARGRVMDGGTLVVCPASLIRQWEAEIHKMVFGGQLSCHVFHGNDKIANTAVLAKYDVVITTYHTLAGQWSNIPNRMGPLYKLRYARVVLDEGHIIRNPKTSFAQSVWDLEAEARWVLTGTPVQNKEFDLFAVIKFLRCSPFDSLEYWKEYVPAPKKKDAKCYQPSSKLQTLLKSILLRRTKEQLIAQKHIDPLPEKTFMKIEFDLDPEERNIYNRLMTYSQSVFANFLAQQKDKHGSYIYNEYSFGTSTNDTFQQFFKKYNKKGEQIHGSRILVLLLRLRQATCHANLIKQMVDVTDLEPLMNPNGSRVNEDEDMSVEYDFIRKLVKDKPDLNSEEFDSQEDFWNTENEVFDTNRPSSKMIKLMELLEDELKKDNKAIVISQWVVHLNIVKRMLVRHGIRYCEFNGKVPVGQRNDIVDKFNDAKSGIQVMLLSLTCGGVGLNLVGANVMFIMDLHWNPQLEKQGQDRIYRFGQKKDVRIYKFICQDSIEERVLELQEGKLLISDALLTGSRMTGANRLTLNDLMTLFNIKPPANQQQNLAANAAVL